MYPRASDDNDAAGRISGRLHTLIGIGGRLEEFQLLLTDARNTRGADHGVSLEIEYHCEIRRDEHRSALDSMTAWNDLRDRAEAAEPVAPRVAERIRSRHLRQLRHCGRTDDLDRIVDLCRQELDRQPTGPVRADLAWALRDRAWFGGYAGLTGHDPRADLNEAMELIDAELSLRRAAHDQVSIMTAELIRVEIVLARAPADPAAGQEALTSVLPLVEGDGLSFDNLPLPRVLHAEALAATDSPEEARGLARRVYAMNGTVRVFDPARPLLTVARCNGHDRSEDAVSAAEVAVKQRSITFSTGSHYVLEAQSLFDSLQNDRERATETDPS